MERKLVRTKERKLFGVCGGIAKYFNIDPTIVRLASIFSMVFYGIVLLAYIIAAIVIPNEK